MTRVMMIGRCSVLLVAALHAAPVAAQALSAKEADVMRLEVAEAKASVARLETDLATATMTIADREQRLTIFETAMAARLLSAGAVEAQRIEKLWVDVEARYRALKHPDAGEVFDRKTLTFTKPEKKKEPEQ